MKTWVKGGLWGLGIILILSLLVWLFLAIKFGNVSTNPFIFFLIPGIWLNFVIIFSNYGYENAPQLISILVFVLGIIFSVAVYFFLGALIGLIVQKIRGKR